MPHPGDTHTPRQTRQSLRQVCPAWNAVVHCLQVRLSRVHAPEPPQPLVQWTQAGTVHATVFQLQVSGPDWLHPAVRERLGTGIALGRQLSSNNCRVGQAHPVCAFAFAFDFPRPSVHGRRHTRGQRSPKSSARAQQTRTAKSCPKHSGALREQSLGSTGHSRQFATLSGTVRDNSRHYSGA